MEKIRWPSQFIGFYLIHIINLIKNNLYNPEITKNGDYYFCFVTDYFNQL